MYKETFEPGKFEVWESQAMAEAVYNAVCEGWQEDDYDAGGGCSVDWWGLIEGKRYAWIVREDNDGCFWPVDWGKVADIRRLWSDIVAELEAEAEFYAEEEAE